MLLCCIALGLVTARAQTPAPKPAGYKVMVEITFDEQGNSVDGKIVDSDDPSGARVLEQVAMRLAEQVKQPARKDKDGKPVKFKVRAPFNFPVEGDEGAAANEAPKPALKSAPMPVFPENLAAAGTVGGAIVELVIGADGKVGHATLLRASHPEFGAAAVAAVQQWVFAPAQKDGAAVESRWRIAVNFSVEGKEADWLWRVAPRPSLGAFTAVRPPAAAIAAANAANAAAAAAKPEEKK